MLIDTHCHLNDSDAFPDPASTVEAAMEAGVGALIVVGVNPSDWPTALGLAERFDNVWSILGWHPNYTADYKPAELRELRDLLRHPRVVALGEIGLDYHWDYSPKDVQFRALSDQLDVAQDAGMPVVFHAREAYSDLLDVLERRPMRPYLLHCFAGDEEDARRAMALDAYFGVDGPITYKKADALRSLVTFLPRDRIVVETDSPYMTPVPHRGHRNQPAYVVHVNQALAACLDLSANNCAEITTANACRFFSLDAVESSDSTFAFTKSG